MANTTRKAVTLSERIQVLVTPAERKKFERAAQSEERTLSSFMRRAALKEVGR